MNSCLTKAMGPVYRAPSRPRSKPGGSSKEKSPSQKSTKKSGTAPSEPLTHAEIPPMPPGYSVMFPPVPEPVFPETHIYDSSYMHAGLDGLNFDEWCWNLFWGFQGGVLPPIEDYFFKKMSEFQLYGFREEAQKGEAFGFLCGVDDFLFYPGVEWAMLQARYGILLWGGRLFVLGWSV